MIYTSFQSWQVNPISTTIETKSMSEIKFPRVIVCPPRDTYTNLNVDLMKAEKITLNEDARNALLYDFIDVLQQFFFNKIMSEIKKTPTFCTDVGGKISCLICELKCFLAFFFFFIRRE